MLYYSPAKKILIALIVLLFLSFLYYFVYPSFKTISLNDQIPAASKIETPAQDPLNTSTPSEINNSTQSIQNVTFSSKVEGTPLHPASGTIKVITINDRNIIRYENFKTINGPDLYVYISKDLQAKSFVSLGKLKANEGNVNYEIPSGVNLSDYRYVMVWCKAFGVLFNSANISN